MLKVFGCAVVFIVSTSMGLGEDLPRFSDVRDALAKLRARPAHIVVTTPEVAVTPRMEMWSWDDNVVIIETGRGELQRAFGRNKSYSFQITRSSEISQWELVRLGKPQDFDQLHGSKLEAIRFYCAIEQQGALDVLPGETHMRMRRIEDGLIQLDFDTHKATFWRRFVESGTVVLDPKLGFAVRNFRCVIAVGAERGYATGVCEYENEHSIDELIPKRRTITLSDTPTSGPNDVRLLSQIELFASERAPTQFFTISHFGFKEPEELGNGIHWSWVIRALIVLAGVGVASLCFRLLK